jgi:hypothetical protein
MTQAQAGQVEEARATFDAAVEGANRDERESGRAYALNKIAATQAKAGEEERARATFAAAVEAVNCIERESDRAYPLQAIATSQAEAGYTDMALLTTEGILTERGRHLTEVAAAFAKAIDREGLKGMLIPCAYYLDAAHRLCGLLARLYPEQVAGVVLTVHDGSMGR